MDPLTQHYKEVYGTHEKCGICGRYEPVDPRTREFLAPCPRANDPAFQKDWKDLVE